MLDFFRDELLEARGIDSDAARDIRKEKEAAKKEKKVFLPVTCKRMIYLFGAMYLVGGVISITMMQNHTAAAVLKIIALSVLDIATIVSLMVGTKKSELIGLGFAAGFLIALYLSILII